MFELSQTNMIILLVLGCAAYYWITNQDTLMFQDNVTSNNQQNEDVTDDNVEDVVHKDVVVSENVVHKSEQKCDTCNEDTKDNEQHTVQPSSGSAFDTTATF